MLTAPAKAVVSEHRTQHARVTDLAHAADCLQWRQNPSPIALARDSPSREPHAQGANAVQAWFRLPMGKSQSQRMRGGAFSSELISARLPRLDPRRVATSEQMESVTPRGTVIRFRPTLIKYLTDT